eukprot:363662-Chlamydomonas_euryale.AAC.4
MDAHHGSPLTLCTASRPRAAPCTTPISAPCASATLNASTHNAGSAPSTPWAPRASAIADASTHDAGPDASAPTASAPSAPLVRCASAAPHRSPHTLEPDPITPVRVVAGTAACRGLAAKPCHADDRVQPGSDQAVDEENSSGSCGGSLPHARGAAAPPSACAAVLRACACDAMPRAAPPAAKRPGLPTGTQQCGRASRAAAAAPSCSKHQQHHGPSSSPLALSMLPRGPIPGPASSPWSNVCTAAVRACGVAPRMEPMHARLPPCRGTVRPPATAKVTLVWRGCATPSPGRQPSERRASSEASLAGLIYIPIVNI